MGEREEERLMTEKKREVKKEPLATSATKRFSPYLQTLSLYLLQTLSLYLLQTLSLYLLQTFYTLSLILFFYFL